MNVTLISVSTIFAAIAEEQVLRSLLLLLGGVAVYRQSTILFKILTHMK